MTPATSLMIPPPNSRVKPTLLLVEPQSDVAICHRPNSTGTYRDTPGILGLIQRPMQHTAEGQPGMTVCSGIMTIEA